MDLGAGVRAVKVVATEQNVCVLTEGARVRCWGSVLTGILGHGSALSFYDGDTPAPVDVPLVNLGECVTDIFASSAGNYVCALLKTSERVRCFGGGTEQQHYGELGFPNSMHSEIGLNEVPAELIYHVVPGPLQGGFLMRFTSCFLTGPSSFRCAGKASDGQQGNTLTQWFDSSSALHTVSFAPDTVVSASGGEEHACLRMSSGALYCTGANNFGQLGRGNTESIGGE